MPRASAPSHTGFPTTLHVGWVAELHLLIDFFFTLFETSARPRDEPILNSESENPKSSPLIFIFSHEDSSMCHAIPYA